MGALSRDSLHEFFHPLVEKNYSAAGVHQPKLASYASALLEDFARQDRLCRVRGSRGEVLNKLHQMLDYSAEIGAVSSEQERALRQYIGDYSLFMTGMFPEALASRRRPVEGLKTFIWAGKTCYHLISVAGAGNRDETQTFALLAEQFEACMHGLQLLKSELESFQDPGFPEVEMALRRLFEE